MTTSDDSMLKSEESFENLLGHASPRPVPTTDEVSDVRQALYDEWQTVTRKHRMRKRVFSLAAAATILVAVGLLVNTTQTPQIVPVQVASIDKSIGAIYVLGEGSELLETGDLKAFAIGQTILTGKQSSMGLAWGAGGSLRFAEDTKVRFVSEDTIELSSGKIYFDSETVDESAESKLFVQTEYGVVTHLGTQYMTEIDGQELIVSVREGQVSIDGVYHKTTAKKEQQLKLIGSARPIPTDIRSFGAEWKWIEATAPIGRFNGKTVYEFLKWVEQQTGLKLKFRNDSVEAAARKHDLSGKELFDNDPRIALSQGLQTAALQHRIEGGTIIISDSRM